MKRALFLFCGICWCLFGLAMGIVLWRYLTGGAGLQLLGPLIPSANILLGLVQVTGLCALSVFSLVSGVGLCLYGCSPREDRRQIDP